MALTLLLTVACVTGDAWACPTCKDGMAGDPAYSNMVQGYFWSILFMMSMPFLIFTGVAGYFYYEIRRARAQAAVAAPVAVESSRDAARGPEVVLQN